MIAGCWTGIFGACRCLCKQRYIHQKRHIMLKENHKYRSQHDRNQATIRAWGLKRFQVGLKCGGFCLPCTQLHDMFDCNPSHAKLIADEKSQSGTQDPPERIYTVCNFVGVAAHGFARNQHWYVQILITKCPRRAWTTALWQTYQGKPLGPTNSCCCRNKDL